MTKKDYKKFANMIIYLKQFAHEFDGEKYINIDSLMFAMIRIFREDNPRFSEEKFKEFINK